MYALRPISKLKHSLFDERTIEIARRISLFEFLSYRAQRHTLTRDPTFTLLANGTRWRLGRSARLMASCAGVLIALISLIHPLDKLKDALMSQRIKPSAKLGIHFLCQNPTCRQLGIKALILKPRKKDFLC
jgi:hypothetical protein